VMAARFVAGPAAPPPPGNWVSAPALPGYRLQARITPQTTGPLTATLLPDCLAETACFSGALRGRTEALVRVIGPRPNGRMWPSIVRFTPSQIEVWIEQEATGEVRYYLLPAVPQESGELPGLIDRSGFAP
jgi:hypothetical protein